eukprot:442417_1
MANKGQSLNEENNMANKGTTSKQWQCTKCTFLNTRNTSQCSMCGNPEQSIIDNTMSQWQCSKCAFLNQSNTHQCVMCFNKETSGKQRQSSIEERNMNQICLCGQKLTQCPHGLDGCRSCCKRTEKEENTYYWCN